MAPRSCTASAGCYHGEAGPRHRISRLSRGVCFRRIRIRDARAADELGGRTQVPESARGLRAYTLGGREVMRWSRGEGRSGAANVSLPELLARRPIVVRFEMSSAR